MKTAKLFIVIWMLMLSYYISAQSINPLPNGVSITDKTLTLITLFHGDINNNGANYQDTDRNNTASDTWARTLRFRGRFNNNCDYTHENFNQRDWNKLMSIVDRRCDAKYSSIRLGWRWNDTIQRMELALYAHIRHVEEYGSTGVPCPLDRELYVGREFFQIPDITVNTSEDFNAELILGSQGMGVIVNNRGAFIKRRNVLDHGSVRTSFKRNAYFGGTEKPPHTMTIRVEDVRGDRITNWPDGACFKTFGRSVFYSDENLVVNAADEITMSEQVFRGQYDLGSSDPLSNTIPAGMNEGDEIPWYETDGDRYVIVESGSRLECNAGDTIRLLPGFYARAGSNFHARINPDIDCGTFNFRIDEEEYPLADSSFDETDTNTLEESSERRNNIRNTEKEVIVAKETINQFSITPNPNTGVFVLLYPTGTNRVSIKNMLGQIVYENTLTDTSFEKEIVLNKQPKGVFLVEIHSNNGEILRKQMIVD